MANPIYDVVFKRFMAFVENNDALAKEYLHAADNEAEEIKLMTDILHHSGTDPQTRKQIEIEREAWRTIDALLNEVKDSHQKDWEALKEKEEALKEKEEALKEKKEALKNKALEEKEKMIEELKRKLNEK